MKRYDALVAQSARNRNRKRKVPKAGSSRQRLLSFGIVILLGCLVAGGWIWLHVRTEKSLQTSAATKQKQSPILEELLVLSPAELERCDIALMNLACAK